MDGWMTMSRWMIGDQMMDKGMSGVWVVDELDGWWTNGCWMGG